MISARPREQVLGHQQPGGRLALRLTTAALKDAPGLQGTGFSDGLEAARFLSSLNRRLGPTLAVVPLAGHRSWKRYAAEPRVQLVVLRKLAESGRAVATRGVATRLFAPRRRVQAMGSRALPDVLFWKILEFWRTDRDP